VGFSMIARDKRSSSNSENSDLMRTSLRLENGPAATDPRIRRVVELLKQTHPVTVSEIAPLLNLSVSRFRHLFKKELNVSPTHYLKLARLERARELLENSFLRVKEITALVGANDVSHFVRDYKAFYGQTPSQTRALASKAPGRNGHA
jgi:transcriptional regulator GlxA family with amidase domain